MSLRKKRKRKVSEQVIKSEEPDDLMCKTIEELGNLLLPERIPLSELKGHLKGYKKAKAVEQLVERARADPIITKVKLHLVYARLQYFFNNGGL